jgi:hypothetical protein
MLWGHIDIIPSRKSSGLSSLSTIRFCRTLTVSKPHFGKNFISHDDLMNWKLKRRH